jgi:hypothetical protein
MRRFRLLVWLRLAALVENNPEVSSFPSARALFTKLSAGLRSYLTSGVKVILNWVPLVVEADSLAAIYSFREAVEAGGLMAYGSNTEARFRQAARLVDRILRERSRTMFPPSSRRLLS